jgi:AraC family transcriptional activator of pobA
MIEVSQLERSDHLRTPRRVRKYGLRWCSSGKAVVCVDEQKFEIGANSVITITSGQVHHIEKTRNAKGLVLEFTYDFFCKNDNDIELIFHNSLFCHFAMNEVIDLGNSKTVGAELRQIAQELAERPYQYMISLHSRIELILVEINRAKLLKGGEIYRPDALFLKFLEALLANFENKPSVSHIASLLNTTAARLNQLAKLHTGKTAQAVIYGLTASEAKRLLTYDKLSVKEVAYKLGFDDPFYFSNFFKKQTGVSPKNYQSNHTV